MHERYFIQVNPCRPCWYNGIMRRLFLFMVLFITIGCTPTPIHVPDLASQASGIPTIFLLDHLEAMAVVSQDGSVIDGAEVRIDNAKAGPILARAIGTRHESGSFSWTGDIPAGARFSSLIGIGSAPIGLFHVMGIFPPINYYGPQDVSPPEGLKFSVSIDGTIIYEHDNHRGYFGGWEQIEIDLPDFAGENRRVVFSAEGMLTGTVLPYWGHPEIFVPNENPKQVILFGLDTVRADHCGFMGYNRGTTPNLDSIADQAFVFTEAMASSPWTMTSFATILSGRPPGVTGADKNSRGLSNHEDMLAEIFRRNGFSTAEFLNIPHIAELGFLQGNDHQWEEQDFRAYHALNEAKAWIENHRDRDFFVFIHLFDPHIPYAPSEEWVGRFREAGYTGNFADLWDLPDQAITQNHLNPEIWESFSSEDQEQCVNLYDAEIGSMDEDLGEFIDWCKTEGLYDNSTIIVLSDHGEEFGDHGRWEHGHSQYEEQLHVPFIIKLPGQETSRRIDNLVGVIDIYPTLLEMFGFTSETENSGESLVPVLNGGNPDPERRLIAESTLWGPEIKTVITNQYKYILTIDSGEEELYDLADDPEELNNIISEYPDTAQELGDFLETYVRQTQSGWHVRLLCGSEITLPVDLIVRSDAVITDPTLITQVFNGSGEGITTTGDGKSIRLQLELFRGDSVELRFSTDPGDASVTFGGSIGNRSAVEMIKLGSTRFTWSDLMESVANDNGQVGEPGLPGELTISIDDPLIAFGFPDIPGPNTHGATIWTIPENLRAHAAELTAEQRAALEAVGYFFD